jgi:SAM-dependent methyltransferase
MATDPWASWLLHRRDGGSATVRARHRSDLAAFRDGVLDRAALRPDDVLLDVGCGTGLVGFGALERLGPDGRVVFCDVSAELLDECRRTAGDDGRCSFVNASAENLAGVPDASVDVVTTRSVLIYCARKADAFAEFFRVLRPGGRLSVFEPINAFQLRERPGEMFGLATSPVRDLLARVAARYGANAATAPMFDFDERDLLGWAVDAGFAAAELDYHAQLGVPAEPMPPWSTLKRTAPNPLSPTYEEAMAATLNAEERARLDAYLEELSAAGEPIRRTLAVAYLRAVVPGHVDGVGLPL